MLAFDICGATHQGRVRSHNEDHILVGRFVKNSGQLALSVTSNDDFITAYGMLFCVADGIGGEAGGDMASRIALLTLDRAFYGAMKTDAAAFVPLLCQAVDAANATILEVATNKPEFAGMGATLSGVCVMGERYWVFNAGDSRVYRYRNGLLKRLTAEHTLAAQAVRSGGMTFEQAARSFESQVLTNHLGKPGVALAVDEGPHLRDADSLIVCSDGLYDMLDDDTLAGQLQEMNTSGVSCTGQAQRLVALANEHGGKDNIAVILIRVRHEPE